MPSTDITERAGAIAVEYALNKTGYLIHSINVDSTKPSWDGEVTVYSSPVNHKRENILDKILIQIKGVSKNEFCDGCIKHPVDVPDLENYAKTGGAIYFVVYVKPDHTTKIYYQNFTPVKLTCLLPSCRHQNQKTIEFFPLPDEDIDIVRIFMQFITDRKKQYSYTEDNMLTFNSNCKSIAAISCTVSNIGCNGNIEKALLNNEVYLYGTLKGNEKVQIPFKMIPKEVVIGREIKNNVYANGKLFYSSYCIESRKNDIDTYCIGNSLKMQINLAEKTVSYTVNLAHTLNERIIDLEFLINTTRDEGFTINGIRINLNVEANSDLNKEEKQLAFLKNVKSLFDILHINRNIDVTKLNKNDIKKLEDLITAFIKKETLLIKEEIPDFFKYVIQDMSILLYAKKIDEKNNRYKLEDVFNSNILFSYSTPQGNDRVTVYSLLEANDYNEISNIDYCNMIEKYKQVYTENKELTSYATNDLLKLLLAYDVSNRSEQLQAAEELIDWIINIDKNDNAINSLNKLQIIKRKRILNDNEIEKLYDIIEKADSPTEIKLGAYILLENAIMAKKYFALLSTDSQAKFIEYPIYSRFGKKLIE